MYVVILGMSNSGSDVDHMDGTHEESIVWLWLYAVVLAIEFST